MDEAPQQANGITAPPPPVEVKIRTMRSDLASMSKTGGGAAQFENVVVQGGSMVAKKPSHILPLVITLVVIAALAVAGWYVYAVLCPGNICGSRATNGGETPTSAQNPNETQSNPVVIPPSPSSTTTTILKLGS